MSSPLINLQARSPNSVDHSQEHLITMQWAHKADLSNVLKESYRRGRKLSIQSPFTKLMSSTQELKGSRSCSQVRPEKSNRKLEIPSMERCLNGEKKEKPKLYQVFSLLMRPICSTSNVSH